VVVRRRGGLVPGAVLDLERSEALTVAYFEGPGFEPVERGVILGAGRRQDAWLFVPTAARAAGSRDWDIRAWQATEKRRQLALVRRWMAEYGGRTLETAEIPWRVRRRLARS